MQRHTSRGGLGNASSGGMWAAAARSSETAAASWIYVARAGSQRQASGWLCVWQRHGCSDGWRPQPWQCCGCSYGRAAAPEGTHRQHHQRRTVAAGRVASRACTWWAGGGQGGKQRCMCGPGLIARAQATHRRSRESCASDQASAHYCPGFVHALYCYVLLRSIPPATYN